MIYNSLNREGRTRVGARRFRPPGLGGTSFSFRNPAASGSWRGCCHVLPRRWTARSSISHRRGLWPLTRATRHPVWLPRSQPCSQPPRLRSSPAWSLAWPRTSTGTWLLKAPHPCLTPTPIPIRVDKPSPPKHGSFHGGLMVVVLPTRRCPPRKLSSRRALPPATNNELALGDGELRAHLGTPPPTNERSIRQPPLCESWQRSST